MIPGTMVITLTAEQEAWLKARVASGDFASIEEAARQLIEERIAERELLVV
jgi:antitoxin ParD1/3/4